ncbi:MAG: deoxyribose-phosphate aldolase [Planctomycetota bacterium]
MIEFALEELAGYIDHTILKPGAVPWEIEKLCNEAAAHGFASVCIHPHFVSLASRLLKETGVKVCTVVDFPLGSNTREMKTFCAVKSVECGAAELDMVMNLSAFKSGRFQEVEKDIHAVVKAVPREVRVKVILETCYLDASEIETACLIAMNMGAHYVKTSTGFGVGGATVEAVRIMHECVGHRMGIKAAGGISTYEKAVAMIECGATRIGTSSGMQIIKQK